MTHNRYIDFKKLKPLSPIERGFPFDTSIPEDSKFIDKILDSLDHMYKEMNEWAMKEIETCCIEEIRGMKNVKKAVVKGIPHEEIVKFASDSKIDMIVMGTQGRKGVERFIFGSTVEKVVRKAPCPVLTVRVPEHREKK